MKKIIYISAVFLVLAGRLQAQEQPHYSLYMFRQQLINPAALGTYDRVNAGILFNAQMLGFKGFPMVGSADVCIPVGKTGAVVGVQIGQDKIGATYKTSFGASFAYRIRLHPKHYLTFGLNVSAYYNATNFNTLVVQDPNDPSLSQNFDSFWNPNIRLGAYYFTKNLYVGLAVGNVLNVKLPDSTGTTPSIRATGEDIHFYLQGGWQKEFARDWKIMPSVLVKQIAGSPTQVDVNLQFMYHNQVGFGASYRTLNTALVQINYTFKDMLMIGYAFNFGLGFANRTQYTGHEVMLTFKAPKGKQRIPVDIPRF